MLEQIMSDVDKIKYSVLSVACLEKLANDIQAFRQTTVLNGFQNWIVDKRYILSVPELDFVPRYILIAAIRFELVATVYHFKGQAIRDLWCMPQDKVKTDILSAVEKTGYHISYVHWLPQKRLAVCSGLSEYGRNNITYVPGWGSFYEIQTFLTDAPIYKGDAWRDVCSMSACEGCTQCLEACPTRAIRPDTFLIDNEICLSHLGELEGNFPEWVPKTAHHSLYGCYMCQYVCPANADALREERRMLHFSEDEVEVLLRGIPKEELPKAILGKIEQLGIGESRYRCIPKNLWAILDAKVV